MSNEAPARKPRNPDKAVITAIPPHPPTTQDGLRNDDLKQWFIEYYPDLAAMLYAGLVTNSNSNE